MRVAVIDIGTNTFNLLIADVREKNFTVVYTEREMVKLGENGINENLIAPAPYKRGIDACKHFAGMILKHKAELIKPIATSAVREAKNSYEFVTDIRNSTGIEVEIISGEREAELIYLGCRMAVPMYDQKKLVMDIGGGSVEFIIADAQKIYWKKSYRLGVARLLEKFHPGNPITRESIGSINAYLDSILQDMIRASADFGITGLIGSSGAFESVTEMIAWAMEKEKVSPQKHCYPVALDDYKNISEMIRKTTKAEREQVKGLVPMRREMIVLAFLLIDYVLEKCRISNFLVSTYSLKEGVLAELQDL